MALIAKKKTVIGGKIKTTSKTTTKTVVKDKSTKKATPIKDNKKVTANKAKTPTRGRKSGVRYEVKDVYSKKLKSLFEECENTLSEAQEPLSKFIESGNKKAAKEARVIFAELKTKVVEFWRLLQTAKGDMKEVSIK